MRALPSFLVWRDRRSRTLLGLALLASLAAWTPQAGAADAPWGALPGLADVNPRGAEDITDSVRRGIARIDLPGPLTLDGRSYDSVLVGEGYLVLLTGPLPPVGSPAEPADPDLDEDREGRGEVGPRIDVLAGERVHVPRDGLVLLVRAQGHLAIRWVGLVAPGARGPATVEVLIGPSEIVAQYLHVPEGFLAAERSIAPSSASAFVLQRDLEAWVRAPLPSDPPHLLSTEPPPGGCNAATGTWCDIQPANCHSLAGQLSPTSGTLLTACTTTVSTLWHFRESNFCQNCPYVFYVLVECGREMHFPFYDMEGLDMQVTNMVTGATPPLRCVNETALGLGAMRSWQGPPTCPAPRTGPWWAPPLDVTDNAGPGHVVFSDSTPNNGNCTTRNSVPCAALPNRGEAPTVVYGEEQTIDCSISDDGGLCGIYRIEVFSGGYEWSLFSNCTGTNTPQFDIYVDCTQAWAAYDPLPELAIANVSATGQCYTYDVTFDVQNIGCVAEPGDVPVRIVSECGEIVNVVVPGPIPALGSVTWVQALTLSCPGGTITFTVDQDNVVAECTENLGSAAACTEEPGIDTFDAEVVCCPLVAAGPDGVTCAGEAIDLVSATSQFADTFLWDDGGVGGSFVPSPNVRNPTWIPPDPSAPLATLTLTATFAASGCAAVDTLEIQVLPLPVIDAGEPHATCGATAVVLADALAGGADDLVWDDGGAGGTFSPSATVLNPSYSNPIPGSYTLVLDGLVTATGCASSDTVQVVVHPVPVVSAGGNRTGCAGEPVALFESATTVADLFTWSDGGAGGTFLPSASALHPTYTQSLPGSYSLTLTGTSSLSGCSVQSGLLVTVSEPPEVIAGSPLFTCVGAPVLLAEAETTADLVEWSDGGAGGLFAPGATALNPTYAHAVPGTYELTLRAAGAADGAPALLWDDMQDGPGPGWSSALTEVSPSGRSILGRFGNETVTLSLTNLPPHSQLSLCFDLVVVGSWDGHVAGPGPDIFELSLLGGPTFVHTTFGASVPQAWPDDYIDVQGPLSPSHPANTGAAEVDSLGYPGEGDAVYQVSVTLLHSAPNATLQFRALGLDVLANESWGLDDVFVGQEPCDGAPHACSATDTIDVTVEALPVVDAGAPKQACAGTPFALDDADAGGASSVVWDDGGAGGVFTPSPDVLHPTWSHEAPGVFTLTLSGAAGVAGCSTQDTVQVQVDGLPIVVAGTDRATCVNEPVSLAGAWASAGTTLLWDDAGAGGSFLPSASVLEPTYTSATSGARVLTLTATRTTTGCIQSDSLVVTVNPGTTADAGQDLSACHGAPIALTGASATGGSVQWSDGGAGGTFLPSAQVIGPAYSHPSAGARTLTLTVTSSEGCVSSDLRSITFNPVPTVTAGDDVATCPGLPVALGAAQSGATQFAWDDGGAGGTFLPSASVLAASYQNPTVGTHALTLTVTVPATGCFASDGVLVNVLPEPTAAFTPPLDACEDAPACLVNDSTNANSYHWTFGIPGGPESNEAAPCFTWADPGTYTVQLTATSTCGTDLESQSVIVHPRPQPAFSANPVSACASVPVSFTDLTAGAPLSWSWDFGDGATSTQQSPSHAFALPGSYVVRLGACNGCGCGPLAEVTIEVGLPPVAAFEPPTGCPCRSDTLCFTNLSTGGDTYLWQLSAPGAADITTFDACFPLPEPGTYTATLTVTNECGSSMTSQPIVVGSETFLAGSYIIPMDTDFQNNGMFHAYGLLNQLLLNDICVSWNIRRDKAYGEVDFTTTSTDFTSGAPIGSHGYRGGPFVVRAPDDTGVAAPIIAAWIASHPNVKVHVATVNFTAETSRSLVAAPTIAVLADGNQGVAFGYMNAAGIRDSLGNIWTNASPGVLTPAQITGASATNHTDGALWLQAPRVPAYCQIMSMHFNVGNMTAGVCGEVREFLGWRTHGLMECQAVNAFENFPVLGRFLTTNGFTIGNRPRANIAYVGADEPFAQADGPFETAGGSEPSYTLAPGSTYHGTNTVHITGISTPLIGVNDVWMTGFLDGDPTKGKVSYLGGHQYSTNLPVTGNVEANGVRYFLNSLFEAPCTDCSDRPSWTIEKTAPPVVLAPDTTIPYAIEICNNGPGWALDAVVSDVLPPNTTFVSACCGGTFDGTTVTWDLGTIPPGVCHSLTVTVTADTTPGIYLNSVSMDYGVGLSSFSIVSSPVQTVLDIDSDGDGVGDGVDDCVNVPDPLQEDGDGDGVGDACDNCPGGANPDQISLLSVDAGPASTLTCSDDVAQLVGSIVVGNGTAGYTYSWEPAAAVSDPTFAVTTTSIAGTYTLTVTDIATGCEASDTVVVDESLVLPSASAGPDRLITCAVPTVVLAGQASGGSGTYAYSWTPAAPLTAPTTATPQTSVPGTYTLTVTDLTNGCSAQDTVDVTPSVALPTASAGPNQVITCAAPVATLEGSASGGDGTLGYSYEWSPAGPLDDPLSATPQTSVPGTYTVIVTDVLTGCTDDASVLVVLNAVAPVASAGPDVELACGDPPAQLDGTAVGGDGSLGYSYSWEPAGAVSDPSAEDPTTAIPGTYTLTVTDIATGCIGTDAVLVSAAPGSVLAEAGPAPSLTCVVGSVTLQGSASGGDGSMGYAFSWEPAGDVSDPTSPTPDTSTAGPYVLTVTSLADGCQASDLVVVVADVAPPTANAGPDVFLTCSVLIVQLAGQAGGGNGALGYSYAWEPVGSVSDPNAQAPTTSIAGTYTLTVTDLATGCTAVDVVDVLTDLTAPVAEAGPAVSITCASPIATLQGSASGGNGSAGYSYSWSPPGNLSNPTTAMPTTTTPDVYTLTVTDLANGCTRADAVTVSLNTTPPVTNAGPDKVLACGSPGVTLNGSASGGSGGYSYSWQPAGAVSNPASAAPLALAAGTYTLTVTGLGNGCSSSDTVVVTSPGAPVVDAGASSAITCVASSAALAGTINGGGGGPGFTVLWSPPGGVANTAALSTTTTQPGTYTLTVTQTSTGCVATDQVVIANSTIPPVAAAGPDRTLTCSAPTAVLAGSASGGNGSQGYSYTWTPAGGLDNPSSPTPIASAPGTFTLTVTDVATGCTHADSVTVALNATPPLAQAGPDRLLTCVTQQVVLAGSASGGDASLGRSFAWAPAGDVSNPSIAQPTTSVAGTYTLTVTDLATGCSVADSVTVTAGATPPVAEAGPAQSIDCDTPTVILLGSASGGNGSLGYSYAWQPVPQVSNATVATPVALAPGTFTLTVTDVATGCTSVDTVVVADATAPPLAEAGAAQQLDCGDSTVTLTGSASGGDASGGRLYSWQPAGLVSVPTDPVVTTSTAGTYSLTVTDLATGCFATDTVVVSSSLALPTAQAGPNRVLTCTQPVATLLGSALGGNGSAGYAYSWSPVGSVSNPTAAQPTTSTSGTYTLTVSSLANECTDTDTVTVTANLAPPVANAGPDRLSTCAQPTVQLAGSASGGDGTLGYTYSWLPTAGLSNPAVATPTTATPGTYTLTVTSVSNGCTAVDSVTVVADSDQPTASAGPDRVLNCTTSLVTLNGSASGGNGTLGYSYSWTPAAGLSDASVPAPTTSTAGTWTLTVTDLASGCQHADAVVVTLDLAAPVVSAGPDRILGCAPAQVTLQGSASGGNGSLGRSYSWAPAGLVSDPAAAMPTTTTPGTYTLTVTDVANGCTGMDSVTVVADVALPTAEAGPDKVVNCTNPVATLEGQAGAGNGTLGYGYSWSPAGAVSNPTAQAPTTSTGGTYTLTVTDLANGCTAVDTVAVTVNLATPTAMAGPDGVLDCNSPTGVTLSGGASGGDASLGYSYSWQPAGGVDDPTAAVTVAHAVGTYTLTVTTLANGCTALDTAVVTASQAVPIANAGPDRVLACVPATVALTGSASGGNGSAGYAASWTPTAGVGDPTALVTTTSQPGTYTLRVTDIATGCVAVDAVLVTDARVPPTVEAGPAKVLTCGAPGAVLEGSASGGNGTAGYSYSWSPTTGLSNPLSATPTATATGTFTLTVTAIASGCSAADNVVVTADMLAPLASAGPDLSVGCQGAVTLQGSASGGNGSLGYAYSWFPPGSVSDPTSPTPEASTPRVYTLTVTDLANGCTAVDTVTVTSDAVSPLANAGPDRVRTCAQPLVTLAGSASGGNGSAGWSFAWTPAAFVSNPAAQAPTTSTNGTYTLTVTDLANGCTHADTVVVTSSMTLPMAEAGPTALLGCTGAPATLSGSASGGDASQGYSYSWSPAGTVTNPTLAMTGATAPGTYTLTVTAVATGCTRQDTVQVIAAPLPVADAGPQGSPIGCLGGSVALIGSASGGDGTQGYTASWTPALDVLNPSAFNTGTLVPGIYTLTVTDVATGCTDTDSVEVVGDTTLPVAEAGPDASLTCLNSMATLDGSASGGNGSQGYRYAWEPAAQVADADAPLTITGTPGVYTLTVTDVANDCESTDTMTVVDDRIPPVVMTGPNQVLTCTTTSVPLTASASGGNGSQGYTYSWAPAVAVGDPTAPSTTTSTPATYAVLVTDIASGCTTLSTIIVSRDVRVPMALAGPDRVIDCDTPQVTLAGSASGGNGTLGYSYAWTPAGPVSNPAIASPTTTTAGTYTLTVTDLANGCTAFDTVAVTLDTTPVIAGAGPDKVLTCLSTQVILDGVAGGGNGTLGYSFSWTPAGGVSNPSIARPNTSTPGVYVLTVTDLSNGCSSTDSATVTRDQVAPTAAAGPDRVLDCRTAQVVLSGSASGGNGTLGYSYSWAPVAGLSSPSVAAPTATQAGTYTLTITDLANGCVHADSVVVSQDVRAPAADAGPDARVACAPGATAPLLGRASGGNGTAGYDFHWEPAAAVANPDQAMTTASAAGTYVLTVTDRANGCTAQDSMVVSVSGGPSAGALPGSAITCLTMSAALSGTASGGDGTQGYRARWSPTAGVGDPNALVTTTTVPGSYTLTVTDIATGCTAVALVVVADDRVPPLPSAGPDVAITCASGPVTLQGSATGGNGSQGYAYSWQPAANVSDPSLAMPTTAVAGTYTLTVTGVANGCSAVDTVTVTVDRRTPVAEAGPAVVITCLQPAPMLSGSASGGNGTLGYTYAWTPAGGVVDPLAATTQVTAPGTYTLTVTDLANGCTHADTVSVTRDPLVPVANAGLDQGLGCGATQALLQGSVTGGDGSAGFTYRWEPAALVSDPNAALTTTLTAGIYVLTVTDVATGCSAADSVVVSNVPPTAPVEPSDVADLPLSPPLRVSWLDPATRTRLALTWQAVPAEGYNIYRGTLASLRGLAYDHAALACGHPTNAADFAVAPGGAYFLVTSTDCGVESSYGHSSTGAERPTAAVASGLACP